MPPARIQEIGPLSRQDHKEYSRRIEKNTIRLEGNSKRYNDCGQNDT